jgi:hypothetical protein
MPVQNIPPSPASQSENDVEHAIVHFLRRRGWLVDRNQVGLLYTADGRPCPVGRRGQCDWRAVRPLAGAVGGAAQYMEIEVKAPGRKPTQVQREYMALRTQQGILVTWADSVEGFERWYGEVFVQEAGL